MDIDTIADVFTIPEYRHALDAYRGLERDITAEAFQRMMERQAVAGTLRVGGITDYPALDIMRAQKQRIGRFGGDLAIRHAEARRRREDAALAFQRQREMARQQFEWQKQLIDHQHQRMEEAQPHWLEQIGQHLAGHGLGVLAGGLLAPLGRVAAGWGHRLWEGTGLVPEPQIPQIPGLTGVMRDIRPAGQFGLMPGLQIPRMPGLVGDLELDRTIPLREQQFEFFPRFQQLQRMTPYERFQHQLGWGEVIPEVQRDALIQMLLRPPIDWGDEIGDILR